MAVMPPAGVTEFHDLTFAPGTARHRVNKNIGGPLSGGNNQIDRSRGSPSPGERRGGAPGALSARAATVFNGAPRGDDPPLICARHLQAELAAS